MIILVLRLIQELDILVHIKKTSVNLGPEASPPSLSLIRNSEWGNSCVGFMNTILVCQGLVVMRKLLTLFL